MVASTPPIIVQLRATIKDTDASVDDESTDATIIEPLNDDDTNYEGLLILNTDYTVNYTTNTITLNTSAKNVTDFVSKFSRLKLSTAKQYLNIPFIVTTLLVLNPLKSKFVNL